MPAYDGLLYEEWASESLSYANQQRPDHADWRDAYEEMASELLSLANLATRVAAGTELGGNWSWFEVSPPLTTVVSPPLTTVNFATGGNSSSGRLVVDLAPPPSGPAPGARSPAG